MYMLIIRAICVSYAYLDFNAHFYLSLSSGRMEPESGVLADFNFSNLHPFTHSAMLLRLTSVSLSFSWHMTLFARKVQTTNSKGVRIAWGDGVSGRHQKQIWAR